MHGKWGGVARFHGLSVEFSVGALPSCQLDGPGQIGLIVVTLNVRS